MDVFILLQNYNTPQFCGLLKGLKVALKSQNEHRTTGDLSHRQSTQG